MQNPNARIVALDVGEKRIGVASANVVARLAQPLSTISVGDTVLEDIQRILASETACALVVGLPRNLNSQETEQTRTVQAFVEKLQACVTVPIYWQDEALTSHVAEEALEARNKPYNKGDIDALAATHILEDYLANNATGQA